MKFHKDAATILHQENHATILYLDSNLTDDCSANAEMIKVDNKVSMDHDQGVKK